MIIAGSVGVFDRTSQTTGSLDQISAFSNRAGTAATSYLTAVGAGIKTINEEGEHYLYSGTSFSAPTVTGAVALMAQLFPNLSGRQIVDLLFKSADDLGAAGTDSIFGRGRLNITRAMQPIGTVSLAGSPDPVT